MSAQFSLTVLLLLLFIMSIDHITALHISQLSTPWNATCQRDLELLCESAGEVRYRVQNDADSFFVVYDTDGMASDALIGLVGSTVNGKQIAVTAVEESKAERITSLVEARTEAKETASAASILGMLKALSPADQASIAAALPGLQCTTSVTSPGANPIVSSSARISAAYQGLHTVASRACVRVWRASLRRGVVGPSKVV